MVQEDLIEAVWLPFLPGYSWAGLLVCLLLILALVGFLVSLFRG